MTKSNSFKRRLLRAAVQDNVNTVQNSWPSLIERNRSSRPAWLSRGIVFAICLALLPLLYAVTTVSDPHWEVASRPAGTEGRSEHRTLSPPATRTTATTAAVISAPKTQETRSLKVDEGDASSTASFTTAEIVNPETLVSVPQPIDLTVFALPVRRIVIDPGHGGDDPGAVTAQGLTEKELALDIGLRLRDLLVAASLDVRMTRERDQTVPLGQRVAFANQEEGDLFLSIHVNWVEPRRTRVVETYYLGPTEDSATLRLAGLENQHSGYSLTDFRHLLEKVYSDVKRSESHKLAESVHGELVHALREVNPALKNQPVKTAPFVVLVGAKMPAILTEVACLSNEEDVQLLASPEYRQKIAQALFTGVRAYSNALYHVNTTRKDAAS